MTEHQALTLVLNCGSFVLAYLAYKFVYVPARVDAFREDIFELRRELFRVAMDGAVSFDHPGYARVRKSLNGFIRDAADVKPWRFALGLVFVMSSRAYRQGIVVQTETSEAELDELGGEGAKAIKSIRMRAAFAGIVHAISVSPVAAALALMVALVLVLAVAIIALCGLDDLRRVLRGLSAAGRRFVAAVASMGPAAEHPV